MSAIARTPRQGQELRNQAVSLLKTRVRVPEPDKTNPDFADSSDNGEFAAGFVTSPALKGRDKDHSSGLGDASTRPRELFRPSRACRQTGVGLLDPGRLAWAKLVRRFGLDPVSGYVRLFYQGRASGKGGEKPVG